MWLTKTAVKTRVGLQQRLQLFCLTGLINTLASLPQQRQIAHSEQPVHDNSQFYRSTKSWIMSSYFPVNWFQGNITCIARRQSTQMCSHHTTRCRITQAGNNFAFNLYVICVIFTFARSPPQSQLPHSQQHDSIIVRPHVFYVFYFGL